MNAPTESVVISTRWVAISQIGRVGIQLLAIGILSRILPQAAFGLLAMALVVTTFADIFRDMGSSAAIIQRERPSSGLLNTVFWANMALGTLLFGLITIGAPAAASAFREPELAGILVWLAIAFPISSMGIVHKAILERERRFRTLAGIEFGASTIGLFIAVIAALRGAGAYSLVANTLAATGSGTVLLWLVSEWKPNLRWSIGELSSIWRFSSNLVAFNFINYFIRSADSMLVGRFLGSEKLGIYNIAYRISLFPLQNITFVVTRVLFPSYSRLQENRAQIGSHYLSILSMITLVTAPMAAGLWAVREPFVGVMLGEGWDEVANVLTWLAPVGLIQSVVSTSGLIFMSVGRTDILRNMGLIGSTLFPTSFVIGLSWGVSGVALAYFIANVIWFFPVIYVTTRQIDCNTANVLKSVARPCVSAGLMALIILLVDKNLMMPDTLPLIKLALMVPLGGVVYALLILLLAKDLFRRFNRGLLAVADSGASSPKSELN